MAYTTLLAWEDFNKRFDIHIDASDFQLGVIVIQEVKPVDFYIGKLTIPQTRYMITVKYLLGIVEAMKDFWALLLGQWLKYIQIFKILIVKKSIQKEC